MNIFSCLDLFKKYKFTILISTVERENKRQKLVAKFSLYRSSLKNKMRVDF